MKVGRHVQITYSSGSNMAFDHDDLMNVISISCFREKFILHFALTVE